MQGLPSPIQPMVQTDSEPIQDLNTIKIQKSKTPPIDLQ